MRMLIVRLLCLLAVAAGVTAGPAAAAPVRFTAPEYAMGNPRAKVTVVEYASLSCPHCARFDLNVFPAFKRKYIDTGQVRFVFRELLTPPEDVAMAGFLLARCAGQARYFSVVDTLFHRQEEMFRTGKVYETLLEVAQANGLSNADFTACVGDTKAMDALQKRVEQAAAADKIESTPSFLINGRLLRGDAKKEMDLAQLDRALQPLLGSPPAHARRRR
jgi:protein-disulfide isomerase